MVAVLAYEELLQIFSERVVRAEVLRLAGFRECLKSTGFEIGIGRGAVYGLG
jgi:hypothetical protein